MPCLGKTNRETMRNYRKNTMINKKIVKTALKILLLAAGIASCVAAVVDSSRRAKEGEDETPATAIKSYSHTKQSLGGGRATYASPSLPSSAAAVRVSATPHTSVSRTATPVAVSGSLYAVAKPSTSQIGGGGSGSSYASSITVRPSQSSVTIGSTGATFAFRPAAKQSSTTSYSSTTVSQSVVIDEPFSDGNSGIQRVSPGDDKDPTDPDVPEEETTPLGGVGALFVCVVLYAIYRKSQDMSSKSQEN